MQNTDVWLFNHPLEDKLQDKLTNDIIKLYNEYEYPNKQNNIPIIGDFWKSLYNVFLENCKLVYGSDLVFLPDNRKEHTDAWVYLNNNNQYKGLNIHNHDRTCDIVGVYYLNIPYEDTTINFHNKNGNIISKFQPQNFDMIVFPSNLIHSIPQFKHDKFRISINLECSVQQNINYRKVNES